MTAGAQDREVPEDRRAAANRMGPCSRGSEGRAYRHSQEAVDRAEHSLKAAACPELCRQASADSVEAYSQEAVGRAGRHSPGIVGKI